MSSQSDHDALAGGQSSGNVPDEARNDGGGSGLDHDTVTILTVKRPLIATKRIVFNGGGAPEFIDFDRAKYFSAHERKVGSFDDFAALLAKIEKYERAMVVRGQILATANARRVRRLLHERNGADGDACFEGVPRHWLLLDFDTLACPAGVDPLDGAACARIAATLLPSAFHDASCWWQLTSGAGLKPGIRLRLGYWLSRPLGEGELKSWLPGKPLDHSVFAPVQPIYVAWPVIEGRPDPVPQRSGVLRGDRDDVPVPAILESTGGRSANRRLGYDGWRRLIGDHDGGEGFHDPMKAAIAAWIGKHGANHPTTWLRQDVERAIRAADRSKHNDAHIEEKVRELDGLIAWAVEREAQKEQKQNQANNDVVARFNAQYAVVKYIGKAFIFESQYDDISQRRVLVKITFADFRKFYQNRYIMIRDDVTTEAEHWLSSPHRRQYLGGVVFDPKGKARPDQWNLWNGFEFEPKAGDWSLMCNHIRDVICGGDKAAFDYVLNWTALMFKKPDEPSGVALVLRGLKGVGKGIFFHYLRKAWGQHGVYISNAKHLVGNFNAHLRDCVFLFADEAFFAGDRQHESILKSVITDPLLTVEPKGLDVTNVKNMLHIGMASNQEWVIPASHDERRYCVLDVSDEHRGDKAYFDAIGKQMNGDGLAAMIHEMVERNISSFDVGAMPKTKALEMQKNLSLDTLDQWWLAVLNRGYVWRTRHGVEDFFKWQEFCATELLDRSYQQWCSDNRNQRPASRELLGKRMTEIYGPYTRPKSETIIGETESAALLERSEGAITNATALILRRESARGYSVGTLDEARIVFTANRKVRGDWDEGL